MDPAAQCLYLYLETSLHAGSGEAGLDIDLPLQRDAVNGDPVVAAGGLRWAVRARAQEVKGPDEAARFVGAPPPTLERQEGVLEFSEARTLLFPVRSLRGVFAWVTSAETWARHARDLTAHGGGRIKIPALPALPPDVAGAAPGSPLLTREGTVVLEEFSVRVHPRDEVANLAEWLAVHALSSDACYEFWRAKLRRGLIVLPEEVFRHFVIHRTEVIPRIRIDPLTGAAAEGALWTEECLPSETLLYTWIRVRAPKPSDVGVPLPGDAIAWLRSLGIERVQLGGDRTLGRGMARAKWLETREET